MTEPVIIAVEGKITIDDSEFKQKAKNTEEKLSSLDKLLKSLEKVKIAINFDGTALTSAMTQMKQMEDRIKTLENKQIKFGFDVTGVNQATYAFKGLETAGTQAGQAISNSFKQAGENAVKNTTESLEKIKQAHAKAAKDIADAQVKSTSTKFETDKALADYKAFTSLRIAAIKSGEIAISALYEEEANKAIAKLEDTNRKKLAIIRANNAVFVANEKLGLSEVSKLHEEANREMIIAQNEDNKRAIANSKANVSNLIAETKNQQALQLESYKRQLELESVALKGNLTERANEYRKNADIIKALMNNSQKELVRDLVAIRNTLGSSFNNLKLTGLEFNKTPIVNQLKELNSLISTETQKSLNELKTDRDIAHKQELADLRAAANQKIQIIQETNKQIQNIQKGGYSFANQTVGNTQTQATQFNAAALGSLSTKPVVAQTSSLQTQLQDLRNSLKQAEALNAASHVEQLAQYKSFLQLRNAADRKGNEERKAHYQAEAEFIRNTQTVAYNSVISLINTQLTQLRHLRSEQTNDVAVRQINREIEALERRNSVLGRQNTSFATAQTRGDTGLRQNELNTQTSTVNGLTGALNKLQQTLMMVGVALSGRQIMEYADQWTHFTNAVVIASEKTGNAAMMQARLFSLAQESRAPLESITTLYLRMARASESLNMTQDQTVKMISVVTKSLAIMGTSPNAVRGGLLQLEQALGGVVVRGQEFKSILDSMPGVMAIVIKHYDEAAKAIDLEKASMRGATEAEIESIKNRQGTIKSIADLRNMMYEGKVTSEAFAQAIILGQKEVDFTFERTHKTFAQSFTALENGFIKLVGRFNEGTHASDMFFNSMTKLSENLDTMLAVISGLAAAWLLFAIYAERAAIATAAATAASVPGGLIGKGIVAAGVGAATYMALQPSDKQAKEEELAKLEISLNKARNDKNVADIERYSKQKEILTKEVSSLQNKALEEDESKLKNQLTRYENALKGIGEITNRAGVTKTTIKPMSEKEAESVYLGGRSKDAILSDLKQIEEVKKSSQIDEAERIRQIKEESSKTTAQRQSESAVKAMETVSSKMLSDAKEYNAATEKQILILQKRNDLIDKAMSSDKVDKQLKDRLASITDIEERRAVFEAQSPEIAKMAQSTAVTFAESEFSKKEKIANETALKSIKEGLSFKLEQYDTSIRDLQSKIASQLEKESIKNPVKLSFKLDDSKFPNVNQYNSLIEEKGKQYGVDPKLIQSIIGRESAGNRLIEAPYKNGKPQGQGLAQFTPATQQTYGITDWKNATQQVDAATRYMADALKKTGGDVEKAIILYHNGLYANVNKVMQSPDKFPATTKYVKDVMGDYSNGSGVQSSKELLALQEQLNVMMEARRKLDAVKTGDDAKAIVAAEKQLEVELNKVKSLDKELVQARELNETKQKQFREQSTDMLQAEKLKRQFDFVPETSDKLLDLQSQIREIMSVSGAGALPVFDTMRTDIVSKQIEMAQKLSDLSRQKSELEKADYESAEARYNTLLPLEQKMANLTAKQNELTKERVLLERGSSAVVTKRQEAVDNASKFVRETIGKQSDSREGRIGAIEQDINKQRLAVGLEIDPAKLEKFNEDLNKQLEWRTLQVKVEFDTKDTADFVNNLKSAANDLASSFGKVGEALGGSLSALGDMITANQENTNQVAKLDESYKSAQQTLIESTKNPAEFTEALTGAAKSHYDEKNKLDSKSTDIALSGTAKIAGASKKFFDEKSAGYRAISAAEKTMHAISIGMQIAELAMKAKSIVMSGIEAVLNQGKGDPYSAFPRMAAMAAIVAALGVGVAVAAGGGTKSSSEGEYVNKAATSDVGTVLGDPTAKSNSIGNIVDTLNSIHAEQYPELKGLRDEFKNLSGALTNFVTVIAKATGSFANMSDLQMPQPPNNTLSSLPIIGSFFTKTTITKLAEGYIFNFGKVFEEGASKAIEGQTFLTYEVVKKSLFGSSRRTVEIYGSVDSAIMTAIQGLMGHVADSLIKSFTILDILPLLANNISNFDMGVQKWDISKADNKQDYFNSMINATADRMAEVSKNLLGQFQKLGEGMLETVGRLAIEVGTVRAMFRKSGIEIQSTGMGLISLSDTLVEMFNSSADAKDGLKNFISVMNEFYDATTTKLEKTQDSIKNFRLLDVKYNFGGATDLMGIKGASLRAAEKEAVGKADVAAESSTPALNLGEYYKMKFETQGRFTTTSDVGKDLKAGYFTNNEIPDLSSVTLEKFMSLATTRGNANVAFETWDTWKPLRDALSKNSKAQANVLGDPNLQAAAVKMPEFESFDEYQAYTNSLVSNTKTLAGAVAEIATSAGDFRFIMDFQKTVLDLNESLLAAATTTEDTFQRKVARLGETLDDTTDNMFKLSTFATQSSKGSTVTMDLIKQMAALEQTTFGKSAIRATLPTGENTQKAALENMTASFAKIAEKPAALFTEYKTQAESLTLAEKAVKEFDATKTPDVKLSDLEANVTAIKSGISTITDQFGVTKDTLDSYLLTGGTALTKDMLASLTDVQKQALAQMTSTTVGSPEFDAIINGSTEILESFTQKGFAVTTEVLNHFVDAYKKKLTEDYTVESLITDDALTGIRLTTDYEKRLAKFRLDANRDVNQLTDAQVASVTRLFNAQETSIYLTDLETASYNAKYATATATEKVAMDIEKRKLDNFRKYGNEMVKVGDKWVNRAEELNKLVVASLNTEKLNAAKNTLNDFGKSVAEWVIGLRVTQLGSTKTQLDTAAAKFNYQMSAIKNVGELKTYDTSNIKNEEVRKNIDTYIKQINASNEGKPLEEIKNTLLSGITGNADQLITAIRNFYGSSKEGLDLIDQVVNSVSVLPETIDPQLQMLDVLKDIRIGVHTIPESIQGLERTILESLQTKIKASTSELEKTALGTLMVQIESANLSGMGEDFRKYLSLAAANEAVTISTIIANPTIPDVNKETLIGSILSGNKAFDAVINAKLNGSSVDEMTTSQTAKDLLSIISAANSTLLLKVDSSEAKKAIDKDSDLQKLITALGIEGLEKTKIITIKESDDVSKTANGIFTKISEEYTASISPITNTEFTFRADYTDISNAANEAARLKKELDTLTSDIAKKTSDIAKKSNFDDMLSRFEIQQDKAYQEWLKNQNPLLPIALNQSDIKNTQPTINGNLGTLKSLTSTSSSDNAITVQKPLFDKYGDVVTKSELSTDEVSKLANFIGLETISSIVKIGDKFSAMGGGIKVSGDIDNLPLFANGGAFTNGIVTKPTFFNMGLMGEAGSEGILPLANVNGKLGVFAANDSSSNRDEEIAELKAQNQNMQKQIQLMAAQNQILQAGFQAVVQENQAQNDSLRSIKQTSKEVAYG